MFRKILCPIDGSIHAEKALAQAIDLAKHYDAPLVLLHALHRGADSAALKRFAEVEGLAEHVKPEVTRLQTVEARLDVNVAPNPEDTLVSHTVLARIGQYLVDKARERAEEDGVSSVDTVVVDGDPANQILRAIDKLGVDCVVMGSRGLSAIRELFMGSVSHKVVNRAPCTCVTVK